LSAYDLNVWSGRGSQEVFVELAERSCINVFGLSLELIVLPTIMDIGERATSLSARNLGNATGSAVPSMNAIDDASTQAASTMPR